MIKIKKEDIEKSNSWPFVEAKKILKERKKYIDIKGIIILFIMLFYCYRYLIKY